MKNIVRVRSACSFKPETIDIQALALTEIPLIRFECSLLLSHKIIEIVRIPAVKALVALFFYIISPDVTRNPLG